MVWHVFFIVFDCGEILRDTTNIVGDALFGGMVVRGQVAKGWTGSEESEQVWGELVGHCGGLEENERLWRN